MHQSNCLVDMAVRGSSVENKPAHGLNSLSQAVTAPMRLLNANIQSKGLNSVSSPPQTAFRRTGR